jgi:hypothetical protein
MTPNELLIRNLEEVRRRSLILWRGLPESHYFWKPDADAMHALEMIRHVLGAEFYMHYIIQHQGDTSQFPDLDVLPYSDLQAELDRAKPWRENFFADIRRYTVEELDTVDVVYGKRAPRKLGDFILRTAYHEAVHAGNFVLYLRTMGVERPWIWD